MRSLTPSVEVTMEKYLVKTNHAQGGSWRQAEHTVAIASRLAASTSSGKRSNGSAIASASRLPQHRAQPARHLLSPTPHKEAMAEEEAGTRCRHWHSPACFYFAWESAHAATNAATSALVDRLWSIGFGRPQRDRTAASIAAMSIFFIPIIASNARLAAARSGLVTASASARGVICQDNPHR